MVQNAAVDVGLRVPYEYLMAEKLKDTRRVANLEERAWRPAAHAAARLDLVANEEPGTMQHFTTALLLGDLLTRLHGAFVVSVVAAFEAAVSQRHAFLLVRSSGAGDWLAAILDCSKRLREFDLEPELKRIGNGSSRHLRTRPRGARSLRSLKSSIRWRPGYSCRNRGVRRRRRPGAPCWT